MSYEALRVERHGPVGWIVFDRPEAGNAMDARMMAELETAWRELDAGPRSAPRPGSPAGGTSRCAARS